MSLVDRVQSDLIRSMKDRDAFRTSVLRMMKAALKNREIDKRGPLDDTESLQVLRSLLKQRAEAIEQFEAGGRSDLADKERREQVIIQAYLPEPISSEEMERVVSQVIQDKKAVGPKDMGAVMKEAMSRLQATGKNVDGKTVNALVRARLESLSTSSPS